MKKLVGTLLRKCGLQVSRVESSMYAWLLSVPRYQKTTVQLLGRDFVVPDARSFYHSHREIFDDQIYRFNTKNPRPVILDCGSNCGTSIVYFKSVYPQARISGVEADPRIFALLQANIRTRSYDDVTLANRAVSATAGLAVFYREGADSGRLSPLGEGETVTVETVSLDDLIDEPIDFLKMDIEGAETEVLCASTRLDRVANLFVEYHSLVGAPQTLPALLQKLSACGFRYHIRHQFGASRPLTENKVRQGMDMQLNIFARRTAETA
jgi:FkbM family methyltransferase